MYIIMCVRNAYPYITNEYSIEELTDTMKKEIEIVRKNIEALPEDSKDAVIDSVLTESAYPKGSNKKTLSLIKSLFIYNIAKDFYLI